MQSNADDLSPNGRYPGDQAEHIDASGHYDMAVDEARHQNRHDAMTDKVKYLE